MYIHIKNRMSILPFVIETNGVELIDNWDAKDLHIEKSEFYLLETINGEQIWINEWFMIPLYINGKYEERKVSELIKLDNFNDIKLLKYHTNIGMNLDVKKNKIIKELFKDFSFKFVDIKSIKKIGEENCIRIDEVVKKIILIDDYLFILPNMKSISYLRETMLSIIKTKISKSKIEEKTELLEEIDKLKTLLKITNDKSSNTKDLLKSVIKHYIREEQDLETKQNAKNKKPLENNFYISGLLDELKDEIEKEME